MINHAQHLLDHVADNGHKFSKKKLLVGVAVGFVILVMGLIILGLTKDSWKKKLKSTGKLFHA